MFLGKIKLLKLVGVASGRQSTSVSKVTERKEEKEHMVEKFSLAWRGHRPPFWMGDDARDSGVPLRGTGKLKS